MIKDISEVLIYDLRVNLNFNKLNIVTFFQIKQYTIFIF